MVFFSIRLPFLNLLQYAHRRCVQRWCRVKGNTTCEICNQTGPKPPSPTLQLLEKLLVALAIVLKSKNVVSQSQLFSLKSSKLLRGDKKSIIVTTMGNAAQTSTASTDENVLQWVKEDKRRMLHVVYHVGDMDRTIKFYTECLGMKLLRKCDIPEERYTNAFLGLHRVPGDEPVAEM